jgi:drug/metabolite transporter, DME family
MTKTTAHLFTATAVILWGSAGLFTNNILPTGVGALEIAFWRLLLSGILFCATALLQRDLKLKAARDLWHFALFGVLIIGLHYVSFSAAIAHGGLSLVNVILATVPALIAVPAWLFMRERLSVRTLGLLALSSVGLLLASLGGGRGIHISLPSLSFGALATLTIAAYTLASKGLIYRYSSVSMNAFIMPIAALALLPFVSFQPKSLHVWLELFLLAALPSYAAHLLYQTGLRHIETSRAALLNNLEPVTGLLIAALFFGERFTLLGSFGVFLVLVVSVLAVVPKKTGAKEPQPSAETKPTTRHRPYKRTLNLVLLGDEGDEANRLER